MLVQLISAHQVVLLSNTRNDYLFYRGQVYSRSAGSGYENLPKNQLTRYSPIWALINMDYKNLGPPIEGMLNIWPIQASPPNPALWKEWKKQNRAALFGMPLWSMKELMEGYVFSLFSLSVFSLPAIDSGQSFVSSLTVFHLCCSLCLQPEYADFQTYLKRYLPRLNESTLRTSHDTAVDAVLEVLQTERKLMEAEDHGEVGDVIGASATDKDEKMADEMLQATEEEVDNAFEILVRNATEEFGFAPRDVYDGIFSLLATKRDHATVVNNLEYSELVTLVRKFSGDGRLDGFSHRVVAVRPCPGGGDDHSVWEMTFKSIRIAREVAVLMRLRKDSYLRETYDFLHGFPEGSALAGWVFEAIVHRVFSGGWSDGSAPQHILMDSDKNDPPLFSTNRTSTPDASLSSLAPLRTHARDVVRVDFAHGLDNVTLEDNKYYIPTATNNPLFDSFTVNRHREAVVISIFQITISTRHEGSTQGYLSIRKIIAHVRKLLKLLEAPNPKVEIAYFLVCPEGTSQHKWQMPAGWGENTGFNDHKGKAFCLRIPTSARRDTSCLLTLNFAT